jgi:transcriptional regulator with XRE-family HTH domain
MYVLSQLGALILKTLRSRRHRALCAALVSARKVAGLSQDELASRLKTSQTVIARIEIGERRIDVIEFIDLAKTLRLDPRTILTELMD